MRASLAKTVEAVWDFTEPSTVSKSRVTRAAEQQGPHDRL